MAAKWRHTAALRCPVQRERLLGQLGTRPRTPLQLEAEGQTLGGLRQQGPHTGGRTRSPHSPVPPRCQLWGAPGVHERRALPRASLPTRRGEGTWAQPPKGVPCWQSTWSRPTDQRRSGSRTTRYRRCRTAHFAGCRRTKAQPAELEACPVWPAEKVFWPLPLSLSPQTSCR